jgi:hypothetical protein
VANADNSEEIRLMTEAGAKLGGLGTLAPKAAPSFIKGK